MEVGAVAAKAASRDVDGSASIAQGFRGVGDQVHQDLADLGGIAIEGGQVFGHLKLKVGLLGEGDLKKMHHLVDEGAQQDGLDDEFAAPGIGKHLLGEVGTAAGRILDFHEIPARRMVGGQGLHSQVRVAQHAHQEVVEVVGDASGKHTETLELLRMLHLALELDTMFLRTQAVGDVDGDDQDVLHLPVVIQDRHDRGAEPFLHTPEGDDGGFLVGDFAGPPDMLQPVEHALPEALGEELERVRLAVVMLGVLQLQSADPCGTHVLQVEVQVEDLGAHRGMLQPSAALPIGFPQEAVGFYDPIELLFHAG